MSRGEGRGARGQKGQGGQTNQGKGDEIDALFQKPLSEFTAARNDLAAALKKAGDASKADQVKALAKPPISAWVANQLYWRDRKLFERLLSAGEAFRKAQAAQLAGKSADVRAPLDARREALAELAKQAVSILGDGGHPPTPDTMRRIMTTLEALATYGESPGAPSPGRLTADVDPPGFEALAALVPHSGQRSLRGTTPTRVIPFNHPKPQPAPKKEEIDKARAAQLRKALQEAERALKAAKRDADKAHEQMKKAAARAKDAEKARAALEPRYEKAVAEADAAKHDARRVAAEAEAAAQAVVDAERAVERALAELK